MKQSNPRDLTSSLGCRNILLLALGAIKYLDVKIGSTAVVVKQQDPALMQIIIFSKARPTSLEENIAFTIIIYFQFIWWPIAGASQRIASWSSWPSMNSTDFRGRR
jgi:hypothetical protein